MNKHLDEAREALIDLENDIVRKKRVREKLCEHLPFHEQCTEEQSNQLSARCWVYATPHPEEYLEQVANTPQAPNLVLAKSAASKVIKDWSTHIWESGDYFEFSSIDLPKPNKEEALWQYIIRLEELNTAGSLSSKSEYRALHCFLHYLRQTHSDEAAFVEQIFPIKHDIFYGRIRRLITQQERPLSVEIAGAILKDLADKCIRGRPNARYNSAEALALCWMCLCVARLRLPTRIEDLHATSIAAFQQQEGIFKLPTLFGWQPIPLVEHLKRYISAIWALSREANADTILQGQLPALRRSLANVVQEVDSESEIGKITFLSFLTPPHYAGRLKR